MRRNVVSTIYNNFIYVYEIYFKLDILQTELQGKNSRTELLVIIIIKDGWEYKWGWERQKK